MLRRFLALSVVAASAASALEDPGMQRPRDVEPVIYHHGYDGSVEQALIEEPRVPPKPIDDDDGFVRQLPKEETRVPPKHKPVELAVSDQTLDAAGEILADSIELIVDLVDGMPFLNGKYALPMGLSMVDLVADVNKYHLMGHGHLFNNKHSSTHKRCHKTKFNVNMAVHARVMKEEDGNLVHVTLQLAELEGVAQEVKHTVTISLSLNPDQHEVARKIMWRSAPLTPEEKKKASENRVSKLGHKAVDAAKNEWHHAKSKACKAKSWFMRKWNKSSKWGKRGMAALVALSAFAVLGMLGCCLRGWSTDPSKSAACKNKHYKKNLTRTRTTAVVVKPEKFKGVEYTPLKTQA